MIGAGLERACRWRVSCCMGEEFAAFAVQGRVVEFEQGLPWRVVVPGIEHAGASGFLRELAASDCSSAALCRYAVWPARPGLGCRPQAVGHTRPTSRRLRHGLIS